MGKLNPPELEWHGGAYGHASASWTDDHGYRYHVWIDSEGTIEGDRIYKNPPLNADGSHKRQYRDPDYFSTRYLDINSKANEAAAAAVRALLGDDRKAMLAKLRDNAQAAQEANERRQQQERVDRIMAAIEASDLPQSVKVWCKVAGIDDLRTLARIVWDTQ